MAEGFFSVMHFHILTLFPEALQPYFAAGILGDAVEKGIVKISCHQLRDFSTDKHHRVDDRPYGGGPGMVLTAEVIVNSVRTLRKNHSIEEVILLSPRGIKFSQGTARDLTKLRSVLFVCGRYEGVDERAIALCIDRQISIGDYILSGGELPAAVVVETVARLLPGVIGHEEATVEESYEGGLLEYPHYTRPPVFEGVAVPEVLLSGNHEEIKKWRHQEALKITGKNRPDLLESAKRKAKSAKQQ